jgi:PTH1 family peptidyl-tRNA hydrolase
MTNAPPSSAYLIAGLGNPGREYRRHRHNVGFMVADRLASAWGVSFERRRSEALVTGLRLDGQRIILAKPQSFMNRSGRAVAGLVRYLRIPLERLLVIYDDLDLPLGRLRLRPAGGSAGHQGLRSILHALGDQDFPRLRFGIGRPPGRMDPAAYVLREFDLHEQPLLEETLDRASACAQLFLAQGIEAAMNRYNVADTA